MDYLTCPAGELQRLVVVAVMTAERMAMADQVRPGCGLCDPSEVAAAEAWPELKKGVVAVRYCQNLPNPCHEWPVALTCCQMAPKCCPE